MFCAGVWSWIEKRVPSSVTLPTTSSMPLSLPNTDGIAYGIGNPAASFSSGWPKKVGENVVEYRWAPGSKALALRESNEEKGKRWTTLKVVQVPGTAVHKIV